MKKKGLYIILCIIASLCIIGIFLNKKYSKEATRNNIALNYQEEIEINKNVENIANDCQFPWQVGSLTSFEEATIKSTARKDRVPSIAISDEYEDKIIEINRKNEASDGYPMYLINGYIHEYKFSNFGILVKKGSPRDIDEYFTEHPKSIKRYTDDLYDVLYSKSNAWYIQKVLIGKGGIFSKEYLEQQGLFSGTRIKTQRIEGERFSDIFNPQLTHFYLEPKSGNYADGLDEVGNQTVVYLYDSKKQPNYYYKLAYNNACAPGNCGIPSFIDIIK